MVPHPDSKVNIFHITLKKKKKKKEVTVRFPNQRDPTEEHCLVTGSGGTTAIFTKRSEKQRVVLSDIISFLDSGKGEDEILVYGH
jgi:hypothetical protein